MINNGYAPNKKTTMYRFTFKPFLLWLVGKDIKKSSFARVNLGISDSLFTRWLKSKDPPISTFLRIIEGCGGELRIEDFIEDLRFNQGGHNNNNKIDGINLDNNINESIDIFGID